MKNRIKAKDRETNVSYLRCEAMVTKIYTDSRRKNRETQVWHISLSGVYDQYREMVK